MNKSLNSDLLNIVEMKIMVLSAIAFLLFFFIQLYVHFNVKTMVFSRDSKKKMITQFLCVHLKY